MKKVKVGRRKVTPSKIVCIGRNYVEHIEELGNEIPENLVIFLKPNSAISEELQAFHEEPLHYEGELCFIFEEGRFSAVGFGLDLTKRDLQSRLKVKGLPWERAKAFDGAVVFSPFVPMADIDPSLALELDIDGGNMQSGDISLMIYKPDTILAEISTFMTLEDGDIVMTGTPKGVGVVHAGRFSPENQGRGQNRHKRGVAGEINPRSIIQEIAGDEVLLPPDIDKLIKRCLSQEIPQLFFLGCPEKSHRRALFKDLTVFQVNPVTGNLLRQGKVVAYHQDGQALLSAETSKSMGDLLGGRSVEGADGFVEQQDLGGEEEASGKAHTLLLTD